SGLSPSWTMRMGEGGQSGRASVNLLYSPACASGLLPPGGHRLERPAPAAFQAGGGRPHPLGPPPPPPARDGPRSTAAPGRARREGQLLPANCGVRLEGRPGLLARQPLGRAVRRQVQEVRLQPLVLPVLDADVRVAAAVADGVAAEPDGRPPRVPHRCRLLLE